MAGVEIDVTPKQSMKPGGFDIETVRDGVHVVRRPGLCNIGVCVKDGFALVIDSGYLPGAAGEIVSVVRDRFDSTVELLFNTHYHSDHTFGNQAFPCPILASESCRLTMESCRSTHWSDKEIEAAKREDPPLADEWRDLVITPPTITFEDSMEYDFHGIPVTFQRLGGHSPDSSVLYMPKHRLLFAGDVAFGGRYPTILDHDSDPAELIGVLKRLTLYDIDTIVPGHGTTGGKEMLNILIDYFTGLLAAGREAYGNGMSRDETVNWMRERCHIPDMPFDEKRHRRNSGAIWAYLDRRRADGGNRG
jgi:glyoxylase-like metal-dependent hydrolase (beta-lactamase superfamily II)